MERRERREESEGRGQGGRGWSRIDCYCTTFIMLAAYQLHVACFAIPEVFKGIQSILVDGEGHPMEVGLACCCTNIHMVLETQVKEHMHDWITSFIK